MQARGVSVTSLSLLARSPEAHCAKADSLDDMVTEACVKEPEVRLGDVACKVRGDAVSGVPALR